MDRRDSAPPPPAERDQNALPAGSTAPLPERGTDPLPAALPAATPVREGDVLLGKCRVEGVLAWRHGRRRRRDAPPAPDARRAQAAAAREGGRGFAVARFLREARAAARIEGEHVARVLDVGALDDGAPFMAMEHLSGRDLGAELRARGPLPIDEAVEYVLQACEAVAQAHAAGIVHRDLKPSNLFLTRRADGSPRVVVLDFGIAKAQDHEQGTSLEALTGSGAVLGTPSYMSPEQIRSASGVDHRTDVWSLGVILYELLSGQLPFAGGSVSAHLAAIVADPPIPLGAVRPEVPAELQAVVLRCFEKDVERRTASVAALARALAPFAPPRAAGSVNRVVAALGAAREKGLPAKGPARAAGVRGPRAGGRGGGGGRDAGPRAQAGDRGSARACGPPLRVLRDRSRRPTCAA